MGLWAFRVVRRPHGRTDELNSGRGCGLDEETKDLAAVGSSGADAGSPRDLPVGLALRDGDHVGRPVRAEAQRNDSAMRSRDVHDCDVGSDGVGERLLHLRPPVRGFGGVERQDAVTLLVQADDPDDVVAACGVRLAGEAPGGFHRVDPPALAFDQVVLGSSSCDDPVNDVEHACFQSAPVHGAPWFASQSRSVRSARDSTTGLLLPCLLAVGVGRARTTTT